MIGPRQASVQDSLREISHEARFRPPFDASRIRHRRDAATRRFVLRGGESTSNRSAVFRQERAQQCRNVTLKVAQVYPEVVHQKLVLGVSSEFLNYPLGIGDDLSDSPRRQKHHTLRLSSTLLAVAESSLQKASVDELSHPPARRLATREVERFELRHRQDAQFRQILQHRDVPLRKPR